MEINTFDLQVNEIELLEAVGQRLTRSGKVELYNDSLVHFEETLSSFNFFKDHPDFHLTNVFKLTNNTQNAHVLHIKMTSTYRSPKSGEHVINDNYLFGYFESKKSLGHILIRPETIGDKIIETFVKTEIDFESNPVFSKKYYMLSDNKEHTENNINSKFLSIIETHDNLYIEINNNKVIVSSLTNMSINEADKITDLCKKASLVI